MLGIGACQMETTNGDIATNLDTLTRHIKEIKFYSPWINLIIAPELALQGVPAMDETAQTIPGQITDFCSNLAKEHKIYLVPGSIYEKTGEGIFNTAPVFNPQGELITFYRKMYPWRPHGNTLSGDQTVVFDVDGVGKVGLCICYDIWFPELVRDLVWKGAEIILVPTLSGTQDRRQELILCQAAATMHQCFIVSVNGLRPDGKGLSVMVDPEGRVLQQADQLPENMIAMLDLEQVTQVRQYGTYGVSRVLGSFFHEAHQFDYQNKAYHESPVAESIPGFHPKVK
jgi:predicted amidohydrolase